MMDKLSQVMVLISGSAWSGLCSLSLSAHKSLPMFCRFHRLLGERKAPEMGAQERGPEHLSMGNCSHLTTFKVKTVEYCLESQMH